MGSTSLACTGTNFSMSLVTTGSGLELDLPVDPQPPSTQAPASTPQQVSCQTRRAGFLRALGTQAVRLFVGQAWGAACA